MIDSNHQEDVERRYEGNSKEEGKLTEAQVIPASQSDSGRFTGTAICLVPTETGRW